MRAQSAPRAGACEPGAWEFLGDILSELVREEVREGQNAPFQWVSPVGHNPHRRLHLSSPAYQIFTVQSTTAARSQL